MGNKTNISFLNTFIELDKTCCKLLEVKRHGFTEYINRLIEAKDAPGREEILPRLVRYRNIRNRMAHEVDALESIRDVGASDIRWLRGFAKDLARQRDPLSAYRRQLERGERWRRALKIALPICIFVLAIAAAVVLIVGIV